MTTFIDDVLAGRASLEAIDDYADRWHDGDGRRELAAFLGLSDNEYDAWVIDPRTLATLVAGRRSPPARRLTTA